MTRRQFLTLISGASLLFLTACGGISPTATSPPTGTSTRKQDILVVGAGIAGIAAATSLREQGQNVVLLEAKDRIGGRIWTDRSLGPPVDLGAFWLHGSGGGNPIMSLADQFNLDYIEEDFEDLWLYQDGEVVDGAELDVYFRDLKTVLDGVRELKDGLSQDISMATAIDKLMETEGIAATLEQGMMWRALSEIQVEYAADLSQLSARYWDEDLTFPGNDITFPLGFSQIVQRLSNGLDIRKRHVVTEVSYSSPGVAITTDQGAFDADYAIITLPLGVLQSGDVEFNPGLPPKKLAALDSMAMGTMNKVALHFEEPFWPTEAHYLGSLPESGLEFWSSLPHGTFPVLVALSVGQRAIRFETMSDDAVVAELMGSLRHMFRTDVPEPKDWVVTRWHGDPFSRGAYSYVPVGGSLENNEVLEEPVLNRLFFAGEATNQVYPGTVHGAYLSGIRAADRILKLVNPN